MSHSSSRTSRATESERFASFGGATSFEGGTIRWRAEHDKSGYEYVTPVTPEALAALS